LEVKYFYIFRLDFSQNTRKTTSFSLPHDYKKQMPKICSIGDERLEKCESDALKLILHFLLYEQDAEPYPGASIGS